MDKVQVEKPNLEQVIQYTTTKGKLVEGEIYNCYERTMTVKTTTGEIVLCWLIDENEKDFINPYYNIPNKKVKKRIKATSISNYSLYYDSIKATAYALNLAESTVAKYLESGEPIVRGNKKGWSFTEV